MNYLIYIERSAENLQFFLWYRDYVERFSAADTADMALAPEWTQAMEDEASAAAQKEHAEKLRKEPAAAVIFKGTDFEKKGPEAALREVAALPTPASPGNPFSTPPRTPGGHESAHSGSHAASYRAHAGEAFTQAGIKQPCMSSSHPSPFSSSLAFRPASPFLLTPLLSSTREAFLPPT